MVDIYVVSLEKDIERRMLLQKRFPKSFSHFKIITAVDGRQLTAKAFFELTTNFYKIYTRPMSPSEAGCSLSHINVLKTFLESGEQCALILEDDIIGTDDNIKEIQTLASKLNQNSLLICGGQEGLFLQRFLYSRPIDKKIAKLAIFSQDYIARTCCYIITQASAKAIVLAHAQGLLLADAWGEFFKRTNIDILFTNILSHPTELSNSNIEKERATLAPAPVYFRQKWLSCQSFQRIHYRIYLYKNILIALLRGYKKINLCDFK